MKYICTLCNYILEEEGGVPASGSESGTRFDELPDNWQCPDCAAGKEFFLTCTCVSLPLCEAIVVDSGCCKLKSAA